MFSGILRDVWGVWPSPFIPNGGGHILKVLDLPGPTEFGAVGPGGDALQGRALLDQLPLVLGQRTQDADHHAPGGGRRVDAVGDRHQGDAPVGQRLDGFQDVQGVPAQPVEFLHHHDVALTHVGHQLSQARAVITGTGHHVLEGLHHTGSLLT